MKHIKRAALGLLATGALALSSGGSAHVAQAYDGRLFHPCAHRSHMAYPHMYNWRGQHTHSWGAHHHVWEHRRSNGDYFYYVGTVHVPCPRH